MMSLPKYDEDQHVLNWVTDCVNDLDKRTTALEAAAKPKMPPPNDDKSSVDALIAYLTKRGLENWLARIKELQAAAIPNNANVPHPRCLPVQVTDADDSYTPHPAYAVAADWVKKCKEACAERDALVVRGQELHVVIDGLRQQLSEWDKIRATIGGEPGVYLRASDINDLRRDAERWRWFETRTHFIGNTTVGKYRVWSTSVVDDWAGAGTRTFAETIDAAIAAEKEASDGK